ncbi:organic cation transporter protein-like isoform X4 [Ruditapes philippinarum]|uniref:organic cation transporter protein-like isoform X4 n=1 Tax=Ruditapes philippinarum TaxID=129788 RepID=UPI00295B4CC1|nr:organic cation transporter protein-like isoform X4 [Ruditapes philippinarum]
MKYNELSILLGEFGKYQKYIYGLICVPGIYFGMQTLAAVFVLATPSHRCDLQSIDNDTYKVQGHWHEILINQSIPLVKGDDDVYAYDDCEMFATNQNTTYNSLNVPVNTSKQDCDKWVYDKSTFESTFITKANLICGQEIARANANMILMGGVLIGAIAMGIFSDVFGRKKALIVSVFLHVGGAFGSAFAPNYALFVTFRFIVGFSNMGMFMSAFVIGMELVGPSYRVAAGIIIEFFWCIGLFLLCFIAYFVRTWNMLQLALAIPTFLLFAYFWIIPESPRWLISKGRYEEANKIIQKCAKVNGVTIPENVVGKDSDDNGEKQSVLKMLTVPKLLIRTLIIYFNWCVVSMVYYGLGLNVGNLNGDIYVNFAINSSMELGAYLLCLLTLNKVGRKVLHAGTMILGGVACLCTIFTVLYADESLYWVTVVLSNVGKFGVSAAFAVIYVWSAELFPTNIRNSGMGSSSMFARVGSMVSPYIADLGTFVEGSFGKALPLIVFGGLSVLAGLLSLFLPETSGRILPENIEDAVNFGKEDSGKKNPSSKKYYMNEAYNTSMDIPPPGEFKTIN